MKEYLYNLKLKTKLIGSYLVISLLSMVMVGLIIFILCTKEISSMEMGNTSRNLRNKTKQINDMFDGMVELTDILIQNLNIQNLMREEFSDISERYSEDLNGSMQLLSMASYNKNIAGVYLLGDNGGQYKSNYASFQTGEFKEKEWYQEIISQDGYIWFPPHKYSYVAKTDRELEYITLGCPYVDKASGKNNGVILVEIEIQTLVDLLQDSNEKIEMEIMDTLGQSIMPIEGIQNRTDAESYQEVSRSIIREIAESEAEDDQFVEKQTEAYLMVGGALQATDWLIIASVERGPITSTVLRIAETALIIMALGILFSVIVSVYISRTVTDPLSILIEKMEQVKKGNLDVHFNVRYHDEIGQLGNSFNHMIHNMNALMEDVKESQEKLRNAEVKALQAQINPHFLYNSLDSIIWLLRLKKSDEAIIMLQALTRLFKITLSNGREFITVDEEVEHVKSYLVIEKIRYSKKFEYEIHYDKKVGNVQIPKLLLQPVVENSIYHGIPKDGRKEQIFVSVGQEGNNVLLSVKDTGRGMSEEEITALRNNILHGSGNDNSGGYGLHNINERLVIYFGKEYGLDIRSKNGEGTEVRIVVPYKE